MNNKAINKQIRKISNSNSLLLLIFLALTVIGSILLKTLIVKSKYGSIWQNPKFTYALTYIAVYLILIPLLLLIFSKTAGKRENLTYKSTFRKSERSFGWCFKWVAITIGVSQLLGIISNLIIGVFVQDSQSSGIDSLITSENDILGMVMYFIPTALMAPFFEELFFRASLFRNTEAMGQWFAVIVTGLSFGLWHTNNSQFVMATFCGMFLCIIYIKTKSIWVCMVTHLINNLLSFLIVLSKIFIGDILNSQDSEFVIHAMFTKHTAISIIYCLAILITLIFIVAGPILLIVQLIRKRKNLSLDKGRFQIGTLRKTAVYFSAPLTIAAFILMILLTVATRIS